MVVICAVGTLITWPVLMSLNATGTALNEYGKPNEGFTKLQFGNVNSATQGNRYYGHVFVGWVFFSFVMYIITRETIYVINIRRAYLLAPFNAARISARTVLFTDVPAELQNHEKLATLFGTSYKRSWLSTDCKELRKAVDERDKVAMKLEGAEIKLIKTANDARLKHLKKSAKKGEVTKETEQNKENGPVADVESATPGSQWLNKKDRPTHKLGKIPFIGKKVDTIEWSRTELGRLIPETEKDQVIHRKDEGKLNPSVFVEFHTQQAANRVFQRMSGRKAPFVNPRTVGSTPKDIVWNNLGMTKTSRMIKASLAAAFIWVMIIFWAIPVAVVGAISNINFLIETAPFLSFINKLPTVLLGLITGLLPVIMLAVLMALVPIIIRLMMKIGGEVSLANVELKCQGYYMAFQVIQVFLVVSLGGAATSLVSGIIDEPSNALTLLAMGLPKASNFYTSYFVLQLLGVAAGDLLNIGALVGFTLLGKFLDKSPRKMFNRFITLSGLGWGSLYPKFGNMAIIAFTYALVAPLLLGFATVGFALLYLSTRYNAFFVLTNNVDTKGQAYAKVLQQIMTGVYLGEIFLAGLVGIAKAWVPLGLMIAFIVITAVYHAIMRHALKPLIMYMPDDLDSSDPYEFSHADHNSYDAKKSALPPSEAEVVVPSKMKNTKASLFQKLFNPRTKKSFSNAKALVPNFPPPVYEAIDEEFAYFDPAVTDAPPKLWIPRDEMGISVHEVAETSKYISITDEMARFNEKGKIIWDEDRMLEAPIYEKRIDY